MKMSNDTSGMASLENISLLCASMWFTVIKPTAILQFLKLFLTHCLHNNAVRRANVVDIYHFFWCSIPRPFLPGR